jgi:hypothetical protein
VYNTVGDPNTVTKIKVPISDSLDLIIHDYNSGKDVRIKPSKRGTFTKAAK